MEFREKPINSLYRYQIIDYKMIYDRKLMLNRNNSNTMLYGYDYENKTFKKKICNLNEIYDDIKLNDLENKFQNDTSKYEYSILEYMYNKSHKLIENTVLEITVPGNTKYNKVFERCNVVFMGNNNSKEGQNKGDVRQSGTYFCTKIIDKIVSGDKFIQVLSLNRIDY
jgi:hypothetical protein